MITPELYDIRNFKDFIISLNTRYEVDLAILDKAYKVINETITGGGLFRGVVSKIG